MLTELQQIFPLINQSFLQIHRPTNILLIINDTVLIESYFSVWVKERESNKTVNNEL